MAVLEDHVNKVISDGTHFHLSERTLSTITPTLHNCEPTPTAKI